MGFHIQRGARNLRILAHCAAMPFRPSAAQKLNPKSTSKHSQASLGSQQSIHSTILVWKHATKPNRETCKTSTLLQSMAHGLWKNAFYAGGLTSIQEPPHHQLSYQYYFLAWKITYCIQFQRRFRANKRLWRNSIFACGLPSKCCPERLDVKKMKTMHQLINWKTKKCRDECRHKRRCHVHIVSHHLPCHWSECIAQHPIEVRKFMLVHDFFIVFVLVFL